MSKRLYKSSANKVISGVCGGIAEYFSFDPTIVRLIWLLITVFTAGIGGVIAYFVCAVVIPNAPYGLPPGPDSNQGNE